MPVVTFRIDRTLMPQQSNLRPSLPVTVQANAVTKTNYTFGGKGCRCRVVYQIQEADFQRLKWIAGVTAVRDGSRYVCDCYGVVLRRDSAVEVE